MALPGKSTPSIKPITKTVEMPTPKSETVNQPELPVTPSVEIVHRDTTTVYQGEERLTGSSHVSLSGTKWSVTAIMQYLGTDDVPRPVDMGLHPSLQSYTRVNELALYVQGEVTPSRDNATSITELSGTAHVYPGIVFNVQDHFFAPMVDGRLGLFVVTATAPITYTAHSAYEIQFEFYDFMKASYLSEFERKVIKTFYFNEDNAGCGKGLTEQAGSELRLKKENIINKLVRRFFDNFYDKRTRTLLVKPDNHYDYFAVKFFKEIVDHKYMVAYPDIVTWTCGTREEEDFMTTVWDCLIEMTPESMESIHQLSSLRSSTVFSSTSVFNNIAHTGVGTVIWPALLDTLNTNEVSSTSYYALSEAFYKKDGLNMTSLETLVRNALSGLAVEYTSITKEVDTLSSLDDNKRFYAILLLIFVVKATL